ncbi:hypothetical protein BCON_0031g00260 [Botryotinia convoluta]|uniref:DUF7726 domain-containing protein n=1 Tax=Botryotinia convoluta TaxID=54673 RepID=A0A4Z1IKF2_9HELO|nr:hypothetical protein BCON_0031g00260 [Botryotinia convoluta]
MPPSKEPLAEVTANASTPSEDRSSMLPIMEGNKTKDANTAIDFKKYDHLIDMELERCRLSHELCKEWTLLAPDYTVLRREVQSFLKFALEQRKEPPKRDSIVSRKMQKDVPGNQRPAVVESENTSTIVSTSKSPSNPTTESVLTEQRTKRSREKLRSILMADEKGFGKEENEYTLSAVQFELQIYRNGFMGFGYKLCDLIGVSQKDFDEFMVSAFGMSKEEGSQNEVCRRSWDLLRELEKERRDEASSNGKIKQTSSSIKSGENEGLPKKKRRDSLDEALMDAIATFVLDDDEDEEYGAIEVYDTCDSLREKIREYLDQKSVSQAAFCRALSKSLDDQKVTPAQLKSFMSKKGAKAGNTSLAFYAGYCFMEKIRIFEEKEKKDQFFVGSATSTLEVDDYGVMHYFE